MILRGIVAFLVLASLAFLSFFQAHETRLTWFDSRAAVAVAAKYDATIVRDRYGIPHISGRRDADAAFGLAYAHAEDDFISLQRTLLAARGRLATVDGVKATENDYFVQLLGIWTIIAGRYQSDLSAQTRALLDGYSAGFNLYAAQHRDKVLPGFEPARGEDVVALFMLRLPFLYGLDDQLRALIDGGVTKITIPSTQSRGVSIAVAPSRSADGATRLLGNPQGPFEGAASWYEARITSGEGWNVAGATMPGSPILMAGAGPDLGWGISSNRPNLWDVYALEGNPNDHYFYRFDGEWRTLETREARIVARLWGPIRLTYRREILRSVHGLVIRNDKGLFAVRYAGQNDLRGVEAFFQLNKARNFESFSAILANGAIPSLDFVYADRTGRIAHIYNGAFPKRAAQFDWSRAVPGNISANLWDSYLPSTRTPRATAPGSGFVVAANSSPFQTTSDPFNPRPGDFEMSQGIETGLTNRARRALALLNADRSITADEFRSYKFDSCYAADSDFAILAKEIAQRNYAGDPVLEEAGELLRRYNLCTDKSNRGTALALLTVDPLLRASAKGLPRPDSIASLKAASNLLLSKFGRLDPAWGQISRVSRGGTTLSLSGGPDILRDVEIEPPLREDGSLFAEAGDSYAFVASWSREGRWQMESLSPFGSSRLPGSQHFSDQIQLFADGTFKTLPLDAKELATQTTRIVRPGKPLPRENSAKPSSPPKPSLAKPLAVSRPIGAAERNPPNTPATR